MKRDQDISQHNLNQRQREHTEIDGLELWNEGDHFKLHDGQEPK